MSRFALRAFLLIILSTAAFTVMAQTPGAASSQAPANTNIQSLDPGQLDGVSYVNNFFGLTLSIPQEWVVASAQRRAEVNEASKKMIQASDPEQLKKVQGSFERSKSMLSLTKLPAGQPNNASFMLIAERVPAPEVKTARDVLRAMTETMKGTNFTVEVLSEPRTETISNAEFAVFVIKITSPQGVYRQKIYVTLRNELALEFFFTYLDEADLTAFDAIMKTVTLK